MLCRTFMHGLRTKELMDSLDSYTAQAICEAHFSCRLPMWGVQRARPWLCSRLQAILELLTMPKNIGLFSKSTLAPTS